MYEYARQHCGATAPSHPPPIEDIGAEVAGDARFRLGAGRRPFGAGVEAGADRQSSGDFRHERHEVLPSPVYHFSMILSTGRLRGETQEGRAIERRRLRGGCRLRESPLSRMAACSAVSISSHIRTAARISATDLGPLGDQPLLSRVQADNAMRRQNLL